VAVASALPIVPAHSERPARCRCSSTVSPTSKQTFKRHTVSLHFSIRYCFRTAGLFTNLRGIDVNGAAFLDATCLISPARDLFDGRAVGPEYR
jgi:hypothetical protein